MFNFSDFIEESYLDSSKAPLYHYTNIYTFYKILNDNKLNIGFFENPFLDKNIKFISLSRDPNLNLSYYINFLFKFIWINMSPFMSLWNVFCSNTEYLFFWTSIFTIHIKIIITSPSFYISLK